MAFYLLKKRNHWYRPDARGYTKSLVEAGKFTKAQALQHAMCSGVTAHRLDGMLDDIKRERSCLQDKLKELETVERMALGMTTVNQ